MRRDVELAALKSGRSVSGSLKGCRRRSWRTGSPARSCRPRTTASRCGQDAAGDEVEVTVFGGWVPSDLRRFLPLAVLRTCLADMVLLPTRFFFASAISCLSSKEAEDNCDEDAHLCQTPCSEHIPQATSIMVPVTQPQFANPAQATAAPISAG